MCAVCSKSLLGAFWITKDAYFLHLNNEDSDQTAWLTQADLRLHWAHISEGTFTHFAVPKRTVGQQ